jgi:hypothetical protein
MLATAAMKISQVVVLIGFVVATVALVWQGRTIVQLRAEVTELRKDLRLAVDTALENPAASSSEAEQAKREKLELMKLRHEVRELKQNMVDAHAGDGTVNLGTVMRGLLPARGANPPWRFRSEWKGMESHATNQYARAMTALTQATNEYVRFLTLGEAARMSLAVGRTEDARQFATDMMALNDKYSRGEPEKANADVVHNANVVLGTLALDEGRIEEAKRHLLAAAKVRGSPVLDTFGPNMSLAQELLKKGEQETVLQYLELCRVFWGHREKVDLWVKDIHAGRIPEFGGNLLH